MLFSSGSGRSSLLPTFLRRRRSLRTFFLRSASVCRSSAVRVSVVRRITTSALTVSSVISAFVLTTLRLLTILPILIAVVLPLSVWIILPVLRSAVLLLFLRLIILTSSGSCTLCSVLTLRAAFGSGQTSQFRSIFIIGIMWDILRAFVIRIFDVTGIGTALRGIIAVRAAVIAVRHFNLLSNTHGCRN